jgi:putative ABC transport system permease protein
MSVRGEGLVRALLRLYPRGFRDRYAADMLDFYRERVRADGAMRAWFALVPDLVSTAFAERFAWLHREADRAPAIARAYSRRRENTMSILVQDVRYALRAMARRPSFTAVVLITLALGIGANAAIFTVVNAVLLRPLPFAHADRVVHLQHEDPYSTVSEPEFRDYRRDVKGFEKLASYSTPSIVIAGGDGDPLRTNAARVSRDFFDITGVKPLLGRTFAADEFSPASRVRVTVLAHRLWVQQFGSDPRIVGKTININATPFTVIGVMPAEFTFPYTDVSLWTPWRMNPDSLWTRNNHYMELVGLISPASSLEQVRAQLRTLDARWMQDFPETYFPSQPIVARIQPIRDFLLGPTRPFLLALLGAVGFILLIACVNVANLLLVRGEARRKEVAIRAALGASASRLMRQMLTESMLFAAFGALLGLGVAWAGTRALVRLAPADLPRIDQVSVDWHVVLFTIFVTALTGLAFGLFPALRMRHGDSADTLRDGGKTSAHAASGIARRTLVVAEITLAVMILAGAGMLIRSLVKLQRIDLGFEPNGVMTMQVTLPRAKYNDTTAALLMRELVAKMQALPGVSSAAAVDGLPITGNDNGWSIMIDGRVLKTIAESPTARPEVVTPEYFATMRTRIVAGRGLTAQDRRDAPMVAVISEGMAKKLWPGVNPLGRTLKMFSDQAPWATIVGVVEDVKLRGLQKDVPLTMYFPYEQAGRSAYVTPLSMTLVARTNGNPAALTASMRQIVRSLDNSIAISRIATMNQVVGDSIASRRFTTVLLGGFAALALLLAGIGIYGVMSYGVSQRTYEIGVRVAMGASAASIVRLVMREGARMTAIGLALGLVGALIVDRLIRTMLVDVSTGDPLTLGAVVALLALVAASACALPARRATAVNPTEALRNG